MITALGHGKSLERGRLSPGAPYVERSDRASNRLDDALSRIGGSLRTRFRSGQQRRTLGRFVRLVVNHERQLAAMGDKRLCELAGELRARLASAKASPEDFSLAFALAREVTRRNVGMFHFPVQLVGGAAMMRGAVAEMQTGEGKTLTAVLPAITAALMGRCVHIVTVNDYLARRDAELLRPVYESAGLTVGIVESGQQHVDRQQAYACDITYCTNKELVFDYLRDRLTLGSCRAAPRLLLEELFQTSTVGRAQRLLLRGLQFAIIDEADSVLIDEARTPLILSGTNEEQAKNEEIYSIALDLARRLNSGEDFRIVASRKVVHLTEQGEKRIVKLVTGMDGLWAIRRAREELVQQALSALHLFRRDKQYIVKEGKVQIVDEYTGRVMPDRSWEHGLHQLIETKEQCVLTQRSSTLARITYQRFFRRYLHLCGMTGTASETSGELQAVYGLPVVRIPTNRPLRRSDAGTRIFPRAEQKWSSVVDATLAMTRIGRAVLIGTRSVEASEHVGTLLTAAGLDPVILNARQDRREAEIVAGAGKPCRVTVATNMAGRGTDILLDPAVRNAGGLHVILTEYHESRRIDRQLFGRAARQGDPGSYESIVALDDELFRRFAASWLVRLASTARRGRTRVPGWAGSALRGYCQFAAERLHARARRMALAEEDRFNRLLGFAGTD